MNEINPQTITTAQKSYKSSWELENRWTLERYKEVGERLRKYLKELKQTEKQTLYRRI